MRNLFFDPQSGEYVEVFERPLTCNHCHCKITMFEAEQNNGNCEECWEQGNNTEFEERYHNVV